MRRHLRFFMESSVNTFSGMLGSFLITFVVMTYIHDPAKAATLTVSICTVWSLIRGYFWRLWIARRTEMARTPAGTKAARQLAARNGKRGIVEHVFGHRETLQEREVREWNERVVESRKRKENS